MKVTMVNSGLKGLKTTCGVCMRRGILTLEGLSTATVVFIIFYKVKSQLLGTK